LRPSSALILDSAVAALADLTFEHEIQVHVAESVVEENAAVAVAVAVVVPAAGRALDRHSAESAAA